VAVKDILRIKTIVTIVNIIIIIININPNIICFHAKNTDVHNKLNTICIIKNISARQKPLHLLLLIVNINDINNNIYNIGHTIPNTLLGGVIGD
tara:strand:+ start:7691 stop:7972 length:282 start_codon:yes stop_codon:yes gene_type:complete